MGQRNALAELLFTRPQQPPEVQAAVKKLGISATVPRDTTWGGPATREMTGMELYAELDRAGALNSPQTSQTLRAAGIPGIRYLDGGSRSAGAGSSNFVVFPGEESALRILTRNGAPLP